MIKIIFGVDLSQNVFPFFRTTCIQINNYEKTNENISPDGF